MPGRAAMAVMLGLVIFPASVRAKDPPEADATAVEAVSAEFVRAFNAGDAKALAALFTEDARVEAEGEQATEGRGAIERRFAERFAAERGRTLVLKAESLRFLGADAALEEGSAAIATPSNIEGDEPEISRSKYAVAYVRRKGRWLQDWIHDFPAPEPDATPRQRLAELEWLVGEWIDEDDAARVHTTWKWSDDGAFLIREYRVEVGREDVLTGHQRVGRDPRNGQLHSWSFDSEGGFSESVWARAPGAERWVMKSTGVSGDGRAATATNVLIRRARDVMTWTSSDRTIGGRAFADSETTTLVRKPPRPRLSAEPQPPQLPGTKP